MELDQQPPGREGAVDGHVETRGNRTVQTLKPERNPRADTSLSGSRKKPEFPRTCYNVNNLSHRRMIW